MYIVCSCPTDAMRKQKMRIQFVMEKVKSNGKINNKTTNLLQLLLLWIHIRGGRVAPSMPQLIQTKTNAKVKRISNAPRSQCRTHFGMFHSLVEESRGRKSFIVLWHLKSV